jgi:hypothetical protein
MPDEKQKFTIEEIKQIPPQMLMRLLNRMKAELKKNPIMQRIFEEYDTDISELDLVPMCFADIDVSAKCDHGVLYFNYKLLCDGDFEKDYSYAIHETTHWLQQCSGDKPTKSADDGEYLNNPYEIEGFQNQVEYLADEYGEREAEKYVDKLLDHHELEGQKAEKKKDELLDQV